MMMICGPVLYIPSDLSDAIGEQYRLNEEWIEAFRAGDQLKGERLLIQLQNANRRRLELTPPPELA
jgi:hypothetical protein